ncbi:hypothetical protein [Hoeflea sp. TYP-13]|uniref:hypothetical protein n=1 Tax=Hoeflea sp. TYP-13 TaxID=3230023 RepID=UPI0034C5EE91
MTRRSKRKQSITAASMEIHKAFREVIDFGEPKSYSPAPGWGKKIVSVASVSILSDAAFLKREVPIGEAVPRLGMSSHVIS